MELKIATQARGVRMIAGAEAKNRRALLNQLIGIAEAAGFDEIVLPSVEPSRVYVDKAGPEILSQMYVFPDKKNRSRCLWPEALCDRIRSIYAVRGCLLKHLQCSTD